MIWDGRYMIAQLDALRSSYYTHGGLASGTFLAIAYFIFSLFEEKVWKAFSKSFGHIVMISMYRSPQNMAFSH